jgi:arsenate reductase
MLFIEYPKCSTCKKAKKFLDDNKIIYNDRNIVTNNPNKEELKKFINLSGKDIHKFFNTSGIKYRELNLKDTLKELDFDEQLDILASDGMLVKRPLLILDNNVLIGFKESEWIKYIK